MVLSLFFAAIHPCAKSAGSSCRSLNRVQKGKKLLDIFSSIKNMRGDADIPFPKGAVNLLSAQFMENIGIFGLIFMGKENQGGTLLRVADQLKLGGIKPGNKSFH